MQNQAKLVVINTRTGDMQRFVGRKKCELMVLDRPGELRNLGHFQFEIQHFRRNGDLCVGQNAAA